MMRGRSRYVSALLLAAVLMILIQEPACATTVRHEIGMDLQQALSLAAKADYEGALVKVAAADAIPDKTADEIKTIQQVKRYIDTKYASSLTPADSPK